MKKHLLVLNKARIIFVLLMALFSYSKTYAQVPQVVQGVVRDDNGPVPGATVRVKNGQATVVTKIDGTYKINVTSVSTLVVSYIGYNTREINVKDYKAIKDVYSIDIDLEPAANNLNEVVVVGFGEQKKVDLTGAVGTLSGKALEDRPVTNALQSLEGQIPGLNISQSSGGAFDSPIAINIRGTGDLGTGSSAAPLVLIDGMDGTLTALNPADIESISVLKDAAASSIYGSRAAFGVILVTTKKGKAGKVKVNYSDNFHFTSPVALPQTVDSYTFALTFNEADANANQGAIFGAAQLQRIQQYEAGTIKNSDVPNPGNTSQWGDGYAYGNDNVDYYNVIFKKNAFSQEHNLSLSGGDDKTTYFISGNWLGQKGLLAINTDTYDRYSLSAKINTKISQYVSLNYSTRNVREAIQQPSALGSGFYENLARQGWPNLPLYDPNGYLFDAPSFVAPLENGGNYTHQQDMVAQQLQLVVEPIKGWRTIAEVNFRTMNYNNHTDNQQIYNHDVNGNPLIYSTGSSVTEYAYKENYLESNIYTSYEKSIGKHYFKATLGTQTESFQYRDINASRQGILVPSLPTLNTTSGVSYAGLTVAPTVSGQYQDWGTAGYFGRLNYNFDEKYLFEANLRYDGSSRFQPAQRWAYFPSYSAGWNAAREDFAKENLKFMTTFKFRGSYGSVGNENTTSYYPTILTQPVSSSNGSWLINGVPPNIASPAQPVSSTLTWETVKTLDFGLDYGFLNNRLTGSFDWYDRKTLNMLGPATELPVTYGAAVPQSNNTDLKTDGWELAASWNDRTKGGLGYGFTLSMSDNQTTITRYPNPTGTLSTYIAGQKLGNIYGFTTLGIAQTQAQMDAHIASSSNGQSYFGTTSWGAGDIMYADYNHDGKIDAGNNTLSNPGDQHLLGNNTPRYMFGFNMHFDYKGFDMSGFFQGVLKEDLWLGGPSYNNYYYWGITDNVYYSTVLKGQQMDYFRGSATDPLGQNLNSFFPRPITGNNKNHYIQSRYIVNGAYLRGKNFQLGYTLPSALVKNIGIEKLRVYVSGDNLFTISKVPPQFDPETITGGSNAEGGRGQGNAYPLTKVISFGVNVTF